MKLILYIVFTCSLFSLQAMDMPEKPENKLEVTLLKKCKIWDNAQLLTTGKKWNESLPKSIIIAPDEKGFLLAQYGRVEYVDTRTMIQVSPHELIRHSNKKYCPMIAAALVKNVLRVVSVMNNPTGAECIISRNTISGHLDYKSHNVFKKSVHENRKLEAPAQAIALSSDGDIIAVAYKNYIQIIDLLTGSVRKSNFMPRLSQGAFVTAISAPVDVHFGPKEKHLAAVSTTGVIDVKRINKTDDKDGSLLQVKDINTKEELIENIHLGARELLYVTQKGEVKIIDVKDWIEISGGFIKNRTIAHYQRHKAAVDQNCHGGCAFPGTIHWTDDQYASGEERGRVFVYRENESATAEEFVIPLSDLSKTYDFISEMGQQSQGLTHVLLAALRGNRVVALISDGTLHVLELPVKHITPSESDVTNLTQQQYYSDKISRARSLSSPIPPSDELKKEKRKSEKAAMSRPRMSVFGSSGGRSKDSIKPSLPGSKTPESTPRPKRTKTTNPSSPKQNRMNSEEQMAYLQSLADDIKGNFGGSEDH